MRIRHCVLANLDGIGSAVLRSSFGHGRNQVPVPGETDPLDRSSNTLAFAFGCFVPGATARLGQVRSAFESSRQGGTIYKFAPYDDEL